MPAGIIVFVFLVLPNLVVQRLPWLLNRDAIFDGALAADAPVDEGIDLRVIARLLLPRVDLW